MFRARSEESDDPALAVGFGNCMRAQHSEGIRVAASHQGLNTFDQLRVQPRLFSRRGGAPMCRVRGFAFLSHELCLRGNHTRPVAEEFLVYSLKLVLGSEEGELAHCAPGGSFC